jgi:hypothetical protein
MTTNFLKESKSRKTSYVAQGGSALEGSAGVREVPSLFAVLPKLAVKINAGQHYAAAGVTFGFDIRSGNSKCH